MAVASDRWVQNVIRGAGVGSVAAAAYVFSIYPGCNGSTGSICAGYAFGNEWLLRGERAGLTLVVLIAVLTIIVRVVLIGTVPDQIGQTGAGWSETPETIRKINEASKEQKAATDSVRSYAEELVSAAAADSADLVKGLAERLHTLEDRFDHGSSGEGKR